MSIESAQFCAQWHIRNSEFFPKPIAFRGATQYIPPPKVELLAIEYPKWLAAVNQLFAVWLHAELKGKARRLFKSVEGQRSIPDRELYERRNACRKIADEFADLEHNQDVNATREMMRTVFNAHMASIPKSNMLANSTQVV